MLLQLNPESLTGATRMALEVFESRIEINISVKINVNYAIIALHVTSWPWDEVFDIQVTDIMFYSDLLALIELTVENINVWLERKETESTYEDCSDCRKK